MRLVLGLALSAPALTGCSLIGSGAPAPAPRFSPNGEPVSGGPLGQPECPAAFEGWFSRLDGDRDGRLSLAEFLNDAETQFARMDENRDGVLVPAELERVRLPYRPDPPAAAARKPRPRDNETLDPVMAADLDLDFKVSREEFLAHARQTHQQLDRDRDRGLNRDEALAGFCIRR